MRHQPCFTLFPYTTLFRSPPDGPPAVALLAEASIKTLLRLTELPEGSTVGLVDRKSTRLNSSHSSISYAVFCLKKKRPAPCGQLAGGGGVCSRQRGAGARR